MRSTTTHAKRRSSLLVGELPAGRRGFTLIEVLIAGALGATIIGLSIQQVMAYFRLQSTLVTRAELRHEVKLAEERLALKLRYAILVVPRPDGYIATVPQDDDACGMLCNKDHMEVLWWRVKEDPLNGGRKSLTEASVTVRAFALPEDLSRLEELFGSSEGHGQVLARNLNAVSIEPAGLASYRLHLEAEQPIANRAEPVKIAMSELVAQRSAPHAEELPTFDTVLANLRWHP